MDDNLGPRDDQQVCEGWGWEGESEEIPCCMETLTYGRKEQVRPQEGFIKDIYPCASE